jgi:hypothetical protein
MGWRAVASVTIADECRSCGLRGDGSSTRWRPVGLAPQDASSSAMPVPGTGHTFGISDAAVVGRRRRGVLLSRTIVGRSV